MIRTMGFVGAMLAGTAAYAQDTPCFVPNEATIFCGREAGWSEMPAQPEPGTTTYANREYLFAITTQLHHGQSPSPALYEAAIEALLAGMDLRTGLPEGTHRPETTDFINRDGMEGRRISVISVFDTHPASFFMDVLYSVDHAWIIQTGHVGDIPPERLLRVHELALKEVRLEP